MSFSKPCYPEDRAARYELILAQAVSLLDETLNPIANLANMAALLADALPRINWCGFYLLDGGKRLGRTVSVYRDMFFLPDKRNGATVWSYKPREGAQEVRHHQAHESDRSAHAHRGAGREGGAAEDPVG